MESVLLGKYKVVRLIGRGGSGWVYEATDPNLGRSVAIKAIPVPPGNEGDLAKERFRREASITASLRHPNIVDIYEFGEENDTIYLVMEFVNGHSMEHEMSASVPAEWWSRFLPALGRCAQAIDYVHSKGIVHGDIKPGNIMVRTDGQPKILDFGQARIAHQSSLTQTGSIVGTFQYLAPEMIEHPEASPQADQYALGVIAYQLATGVRPFESDSLQSTVYRVMTEAPVPANEKNPELAASASAAISKALSKKPADRFHSCTELLNELLSAPAPEAKGSPVSAPPAMPPAPTPASGPPVGAGGGWFTRLFHTPAAAVPPPPAPFSVPPAPPAPIQPGDGEQTRLLRRPSDSRLEPRELARRQALELIERANAEAFEGVVALEGKWLPGVEGADATLLAFREAARYLVAARNASSPHNAAEHLARAEAVIVAAGNQLLRSQKPQDVNPAAAEMPAALQVWKDYTRRKLAEARELVARQLPNPYRAGQPLRPDQGRLLFRGRDQVVSRIESVLADANQSGSIALLGPRRCGKTSLLQMLPALLPDCVCVFFDLQDNPVDSTQAFFQALERQAREQSRRDRRVELPPLPDGGTFGSATQWLQDLDNLPGDFRILLCLDEFERLEDLFPGNRQDLLRLMGLFRATIQHRRRLRLLVSGVAPFDELGQIWNDHFINVREIRVGHLDRAAALDLLIRPVTDFPADAVPEAVAAEVFARTGGQPYLLQLYGSLLISRLNEEQRRVAVFEDVAKVEEEAMGQGAYYFRHTYESAPEAARQGLEELAAGRRPAFTPTVRRWLMRRGLVDEAGSLCIPVLGTFMRDELSLQ